MKRNYRVFLTSNSILALALGFFAPFWIIFLRDFGGGIEQFGFAIGLMALAQSITSYYAGKYSDRFGRKPILILGGFILAASVFSYTIITILVELYVLQIIMGITSAMQTTVETTFLGDITRKSTRGADIGKYNAIVGIIAGLAMMTTGYIAGAVGLNIIFYTTAIIILVSTLILFYIKE